MARGGQRKGVQGRNYGNRTDLAMNARPLPVQVGPSRQYGQGVAQANAQSAVPLAPPPAPGTGPTPGQSTPGPEPGSFGFEDETGRPNEPLTAGANIGAGPGMEALELGEQPITHVADMFEMLYANSGIPEMKMLADRSRALGGR